MTFRKEKKFRLTASDLSISLNSLFELGMSTLYPSRLINSCYFDTQNMDIFNNSEEGVLPRSKIRVRWYEKTYNFNKEIKISSVEGRFKTSTPQHNFRSVDDRSFLNWSRLRSDNMCFSFFFYRRLFYVYR